MESFFKGISMIVNGFKVILSLGRFSSYDEVDTLNTGSGSIKKDVEAINKDWEAINKDFDTIWGYFNAGKRGGKE